MILHLVMFSRLIFGLFAIKSTGIFGSHSITRSQIIVNG